MSEKQIRCLICRTARSCICSQLYTRRWQSVILEKIFFNWVFDFERSASYCFLAKMVCTVYWTLDIVVSLNTAVYIHGKLVSDSRAIVRKWPGLFKTAVAPYSSAASVETVGMPLYSEVFEDVDGAGCSSCWSLRTHGAVFLAVCQFPRLSQTGSQRLWMPALQIQSVWRAL